MPESSKPFNTYETVPLRSDEVNYAVIQSKLNIYDHDKAEKQIKENLDRMLWLADQAQYWDLRRDVRKDILVFHEFPLQGFHIAGSREEELRVAIEVPGPETEAIGKKAKQLNCYIAFGCYGKLKEWPGHFIDLGILINPKGEIIMQNWKPRQLSGLAFSTSIYDVLDRYVEMYGWDAVFPVARTEIGNIAFLPCVYEYEIARALALKGTEVFIRPMTIGAGYWTRTPLPALRGGPIHNLRMDLQAACQANMVYGVFVNNAASGHEAIGDWAAGASAIIDHDGCIMSEAMSTHETMVINTLPLASYRKKHQLPNLPLALFTDMHKRYEPKVSPNGLLKYLPRDQADAIAYFKSLMKK